MRFIVLWQSLSRIATQEADDALTIMLIILPISVIQETRNNDGLYHVNANYPCHMSGAFVLKFLMYELPP